MPSKEYKPRMPALWWTKNVQLLLFMIRELSAVFAALYVMYLLALMGLGRSSHGGMNSTYDNVLRSKAALILQLIALVFVVFHSITWFNLTPKIMVVWRGEEKVSPFLIAGANYALWLIMSVVVLFVIFPPQQ
jgi:fumarate reductase subunit C